MGIRVSVSFIATPNACTMASIQFFFFFQQRNNIYICYELWRIEVNHIHTQTHISNGHSGPTKSRVVLLFSSIINFCWRIIRRIRRKLPFTNYVTCKVRLDPGSNEVNPFRGIKHVCFFFVAFVFLQELMLPLDNSGVDRVRSIGHCSLIIWIATVLLINRYP